MKLTAQHFNHYNNELVFAHKQSRPYSTAPDGVVESKTSTRFKLVSSLSPDGGAIACMVAFDLYAFSRVGFRERLTIQLECEVTSLLTCSINCSILHKMPGKSGAWSAVCQMSSRWNDSQLLTLLKTKGAKKLKVMPKLSGSPSWNCEM